MIDVKLPRIIGSNLEVHPLSLSVNLDITPLSTASMRLPKNENLPSRGYVELYTPIGSAGIFRVRSPEDAYGDDTTAAQLEHAISEVGDYLVRAEISEMMAATTAMQTIFGHYRGSRWQLGSVSALGSGNVAVECNYERVLDAMLGILEQRPSCMMSFDFSTSPWTVNIVARDSSVSAEGRLSRNIRSAKVITDDTELCTRIYYQIPGTDSEGQPIQVWTHMDADTIGTYGVVERELQSGSDYTESEANAAASEYLRQHKHPRITIEIDGEELSSITGETFDRFTIGKLMRLALPDYNTSVTENITGLSWADVFNAPRQLSVRLGAEEDTVVNFLHQVDTKGGTDGGNGGGHGGGGGGRKTTEDIWKEFRVRFEQDDYHFGVISEHVDHAENVLEAAGMDVNSQTGAIIYHDDVANGVGARLTAQANALNGTQSQVAMVVGHGSGGNFIKAAEIAIAMNNSTGETEAKIDADHVYIGNTKSSTVIAGKCSLSDVTASYISSQLLNAGHITVNGMTVVGDLYVSTGQHSQNVTAAIWDLNIAQSGDTYTLQRKRMSDSAWVDVGTFSRATTLSGAWSGGTLTVSASPQGDTFTVDLFTGGHWGYASGETWTTYYGNVSAKHNGGSTSYSTGESYTANALDIFQTVTVTKQGSAESVYVPDAGGTKYYVSGGSASGTKQGSAGPKLALYNSSIQLYYKNSSGTYSPATSGAKSWYYNNTNGTQYYLAGSTYAYSLRSGDGISLSTAQRYKAGSSATYYERRT